MPDSIHAGIVHDLEAEEYHYTCSTCSTQLYAPTKVEIQSCVPLYGGFINSLLSSPCF